MTGNSFESTTNRGVTLEKEIDQFGRDVTTAPPTNPPLILTEPMYLDVFQPSLLPPVSTEPQFTDELLSALNDYETRLQNTRDGNAALKNWRMGNYNAVSEIMQRNPNIGIRLDGRLTLMGSQAADYLLNSNGFGDETNAFLGYSGPFTFNAVGSPNQTSFAHAQSGQTGQKKGLPKPEDIRKGLEKLIKKKACAKWLAGLLGILERKEFTQEEARKKILDVFDSIVKQKGLMESETPDKDFENDLLTNAVAKGSIADGTAAIYYNPQRANRYNYFSITLHEVTHHSKSDGVYSDKDLARASSRLPGESPPLPIGIPVNVAAPHSKQVRRYL